MESFFVCQASQSNPACVSGRQTIPNSGRLPGSMIWIEGIFSLASHALSLISDDPISIPNFVQSALTQWQSKRMNFCRQVLFGKRNQVERQMFDHRIAIRFGGLKAAQNRVEVHHA